MASQNTKDKICLISVVLIGLIFLESSLKPKIVGGLQRVKRNVLKASLNDSRRKN